MHFTSSPFILATAMATLLAAATALPASQSDSAVNASSTFAPDSPEKSGGYIASCDTIHLTSNNGDHILNVNCMTDSGGVDSTTLKLGLCIGNDNGQLVYEKNGGFGGSYDTVVLRAGPPDNKPDELYARCANGKGAYIATHVNLDNSIGNFNGRLGC